MSGSVGQWGGVQPHKPPRGLATEFILQEKEEIKKRKT